MGTNGSRFAIWVIIILSSSSTLSFNTDHLNDPVALDSYLHNHTFSAIPNNTLGVLHKVPLPSNFSGMEVSIIRMKSIAIWKRGARFNPLFNIPSRILPLPFAIRLEIMYENLGNLSSYYYNLPGYSFLAPVIGFSFYDAVLSQKNINQKLNLTVLDKPITINFTTIVSPSFKMTRETKCVRFDLNGQVELSEMVIPNICTSRLEGHFSIASPGVPPPPPPVSPPSRRRRKKAEVWRWWVIGLAAGLFGIILVALIAMVVYRGFMVRRIKWMEKKSEGSEVLENRWIRDSKMPFASMTRTQPTLEIE